MSSEGQKVTTDPRSKQEIPEAVGVVTSDSLAGESLKGSGSFGEGNPKAAASNQPSKSTNTNNTDTSSARVIEPDVNSGAREAKQGGNQDDLNSGKGQGKEAGVGPTYATTSSSGTTSATGGVPSTGSTGGTAVPSGPTGGYAGAAEQARNPGEFKPKGKNITEGGFDSDAPNASFNNADIGSKDDPGRAAEQKMLLKTAQSGADAGGPKQGEVSGQTGAYDTLKSDENV